ncbi:hypothetical protein [uncultured Sphingomonas sp.]|uniref:hypothetical protein n=1 Tax=uncultured Sphingomonas sp. TaxID=158754 RepID=UPI0025DDDB7A|nr:hypothetical protein [uncultured Sphingomonas sp.]
MTDQQTNTPDDVEAMTDEQRSALLQEEAARGAQFGQQGDRVDTGLGKMGGAGAQGGIGPDIAEQSNPATKPL